MSAYDEHANAGSELFEIKPMKSTPHPAPPEAPAWAVKAEARISDNYNCDPVADTARSYLDTHDIARLIWEEYQEHAREACPPPAAARDGGDSARLDWLEGRFILSSRAKHPEDGLTWFIADGLKAQEKTLRACIDAAMKGTP